MTGPVEHVEVRLDPTRAGPTVEELEEASRTVRACGYRLIEWSLAPGRNLGGGGPAAEASPVVLALLGSVGEELVAVADALAADAWTLAQATARAVEADRGAVDHLAGILVDGGAGALRHLAPPLVGQAAVPLAVAGAAAAVAPLGPLPWSGVPRWPPTEARAPGADRGGGLEREARGPLLAASGRDATDRGRRRARQLLALTGGPQDDEQAVTLAADEIGLVALGPATYAVVLPGVVDLTRPWPGLDPHHRSVRDLDRHAMAATVDARPEADPYARMVALALDRHAVPPGASLLLVGHSYGAGAAVRLAAAPGLLGGRRATHVLATGYHADPWVDQVPPSTRVLVLQNERDLMVAAGAVLHRAIGPGPAEGDTATAVIHRFPGGWSRAGHDQKHYLAELEAAGHPDVTAFLTELDVRGYSGPGQVSSIDVSVP